MKINAQDGMIKVIRKHETSDAIGKLFGWNGDPK